MLVVGSEVPNLLQPSAASTLVVSQDLDLGVYVSEHRRVAERLDALSAFTPSPEEPSVLVPADPALLELNFVGIDPSQDPTEAYVLPHERLPLLVFGALSLVSPGKILDLEGTRVPLPRVSGLLLEKLVTERTGEKGERDLLVALGLLLSASPEDVAEAAESYRGLRPELRHAVRSNLTLLSLLGPRAGMPDPGPGRRDVADLLGRLESAEGRP